ncbi:MAG TPA: VCBS repeat-containing protein, partial [Flavisolibacter sp.]|nr:VCBS repeat-containing protein [Flavisolibacter sp.]
KGRFRVADPSIISLKQIGMVTTSVFTDINHDGWADLVIGGEWMPIKVFINDHGKFRATEIGHSSGLWQTISVADVNSDGFPDLLAGNWGQNSKLFAGKEGPLKLYVKDFDNNGSVEQIMTYTINGQEYPFLGKDQLEMALPKLKKDHLSYNDVAGKTVQYLMGDMFQGYLELKAETLSSSCFINDGKGNFTKIDLPAELQLSPVFSFSAFDHDSRKNYIAAGNFYGVSPYEGQYDAMLPSIFAFDKKTGKFYLLSQLSTENGEFRDARCIQAGHKTQLLILARNNNKLIFLKPASKS